MNLQYIRLARNLINQQSELIPIDSDIYKKVNLDTDWYKSIFVYQDEHFIEFQKTRSVAGLRGLKTNKILFDFDSQDLELARKDSIEICSRLVESGINKDNIQIFFSGGKGFHVACIFDEYINRQEFINITFGLASELKSFDQKINDENRLIRLPLTKHPKSGLYKIPLSFKELNELSIETIKEYASTPKEYNSNLLNDDLFKSNIPTILNELKIKNFKKIYDEVNFDIKGFNIKDIDIAKCPKWLDKARFILSEGFFYGTDSVNQGERNISFMILAATFKGQGFSAEHTLALLEVTAEKQALRTGEDPYTPEQLQREIINPVFSPSWKGGIYGKDEPILQLTRQRFNLIETESNIDLVDIKDVGSDFKDFAKNIDKNTIKTGLKSLDDNVLITSGMMVALLAAPGAGKTSFANLFVENLSQAGENTIFFSLDMYKNLLFSRLLQKYSGYDMRKILHMFKNDSPDKVLMDAYTDVLKNYNNAHFNFRSGPTVEEIEQEVITYQQEKGKNAKLIVVDYLEKVRGPFSDATANSAYVASRLSDLAKKYHTTVLLLVQPQKSAGDPREELVSYRKIKGASVIEQDSRVILTMSRPGYDPKNMDNDNFATISVVKNNMGGLCQLDFGWEGITGQLTELNGDQRRELKSLRESIEEEKNAKDKAWDI